MVKTRGGGSSNHKPNEPNKHAEYSGGEVEAAEIYTMMSANQRSVKLFSQSVKYIALIAFLHIISSILSPILSINSIMEDGVFGRFPRFVSACPRVRVCMRTHGHFAPRQLKNKRPSFLSSYFSLFFLFFSFPPLLLRRPTTGPSIHTPGAGKEHATTLCTFKGVLFQCASGSSDGWTPITQGYVDLDILFRDCQHGTVTSPPVCS